jgi:hypothetical protein
MRKDVRQAERMAREIERRQRELSLLMPGSDPHDLNLLIWASLRQKYGVPRCWLLRRRRGGGYVY